MKSLTQGLRELADFLEANPTIDAGVQSYNVFIHDRETLATIARLGSWEKVWDGDYFMLRKTFSDGLVLDINVPRAVVCEKIVTGKRTVPATPEHEEEVTEWRCSNDSLLAGTSVTAS